MAERLKSGAGSETAAAAARSGRHVPGRRLTLAVACVLMVLGGTATSAAAYTAPLAPAAPRAADAGPTPQPSPGTPPTPAPGTATGDPAVSAPTRGPRAGDAGAAGPGPVASGGPGTPRPSPPSGGAGDADRRESAGSSEDAAPTLRDVRRRIARLHDRAEAATEDYNAADEKADAQRKKLSGLERRARHTRKQLGELTDRAGALAREQYRTGGLSGTARLMLSDDPDAFLRDAGLARREQRAAKSLVASLTETRDRLARYTREAEERHDTLRKHRTRAAKARKRVERQLKQAERTASRLSAEQRADLREMERSAAAARQLRWLRTGILEEIDGRASAKGRKAVAYAMAQVGKDYEWGAEGPATYDCSGLTMRAWEAAGVRIPRTSQEQWRDLTRVDVADMRPGDLIIYTADAGHVGMYLGDGVMVHAPRTGLRITVQGAGSYAIRGVVRPDV
ncbi:NlpC/P60 family protein [Streptomyces sp. TR06-5]|uniref:C40 family peptidase n=1 Tax=Streptomyces sp. TR06-5 TaxID=3385976 RepID=UPI0039A38AD1